MRNSVFILFIFLLFNTGLFAQNGFDNFVTRKGNKLLDGDKTFRFLSFNVPTLNFNEDEFEFSKIHPYSLPTEFEIRDIFESVNQMGGKVVRLYTLPVKMETETGNVPEYVSAPGVFNEKSFKTMDLVLALANEYKVRVIFSFLNNWQWMGGAPQYAGFRGKEFKKFWTDQQLINDFKKTIEYTINRKNTITGILYKNDKSIMAWETGNELQCPPEWTSTILAYVKSMDQNHLTIDGYFACDANPVRDSSVNDPSVDIISSHHYEQNPNDFFKNINRNLQIIANKKPYLIGEFGFISTSAMKLCLEKVFSENIAGLCIWGLRGHRSSGGFYWHSEPLGYGRYKSYHWPGFRSGDEYDEKVFLNLIREQAYRIDGKNPPLLKRPKAPELLPVADVSSISWRGSAGATTYDLYRSEEPSKNWKICGWNLNDAHSQYVPLFQDKTAEMGKSYYYRLIAKNSAGESEPSGISGPVKVNRYALIDNMENFGTLYYSSKEVIIKTNDDRQFKEDMFRMSGNIADEIIYAVDGTISEFKVFSFCQNDTTNLEFSVSGDGEKYTKLEAARQSFANGKGDYGYWVPVKYELIPKQKGSYLRISFKSKSEIGRVEIFYL